MKRLVLWLTAIASLFVIGGQVMQFFVNLNTLKEQRVQKKLEQVKA